MQSEPSISRTALITGGSRGIGAAATLALAARGYNVLFNYRNKSARAEEVAASARGLGVRAEALSCDITRAEDLARLFSTLGERFGSLDLLVLNASGGMERDLLTTNPDYPMVINRDAQVALLEGALPYMARGGAVVFVTSHWAHLYGRVKQIPNYESVAASKYAGEQELRARLAELTARGIRLVVVTGDLIEGTITPKLLERAAPGLADGRRNSIGALPTAEEMGEIIAASAVDASLPTGHTVVIGGSLEDLLHQWV
ncbi:short chain dehydrogenase [Ktedonobacter sp. SOSP1-85]|uniref:SDR family oxidoreductase n=1 Tax=Ktedonobacter sp. SOSP1-85 TaxID=2778367 RepID=UPI001915B90C|nr:SDR family oxidoreductase [Ktedonobacter sp. SOSP1-85]GHO75692.1 short chain dehydrogenase [Ktedonobacter sp. SOSP1-85]